jgi:hypothetical protein
MPRQKSLLTVIRDLVKQEVGQTIASLLGTGQKKRRRRRRRRGPGRPPKRRGRRAKTAAE